MREPFIFYSALTMCAPGCSDTPQRADDFFTVDAGLDGAPTDPLVRLADVVHAAPGATGIGYGDSNLAVNGVRGAGVTAGGVDVFSLRFVPEQDNFITLGWSEEGVLANGPGIDLVVFENPFQLDGPERAFMDLVIVELSRDGTAWVAFPHDFVAADEGKYTGLIADWTGFAGRTPVLLHAENNPVDPFDVSLAGGDGFDMDALPDTVLGNEIREHGAVYVRLVTAPSRINPDTGMPFVRDPVSDGADIDGVFGRYVAPPTP